MPAHCLRTRVASLTICGHSKREGLDLTDVGTRWLESKLPKLLVHRSALGLSRDMRNRELVHMIGRNTSLERHAMVDASPKGWRLAMSRKLTYAYWHMMVPVESLIVAVSWS